MPGSDEICRMDSPVRVDNKAHRALPVGHGLAGAYKAPKPAFVIPEYVPEIAVPAKKEPAQVPPYVPRLRKAEKLRKESEVSAEAIMTSEVQLVEAS